MVYNEKRIKEDKICVFEMLQETQCSHSHDFFELVYIREGEISHVIEGKKHHVKKGNYFIINTNDKHWYEAVSNIDCQIINCLFYPEFIDITMKYCKNFSQLIESYLIKFNQSILSFNPTMHLFYDSDGNIKFLIESIMREWENKKRGYTELARCYLIEIIINTMRKITDSEKELKDSNPTGFIKAYIEKNYNCNISLSEICAELNYSISYMSLKFKKDTGLLFTEYLQKYRVNQSCLLIAGTNKKISEIAEMVGYDDTKFFVSVFKKYMNMTPKDFRNNNKLKFGS